MEDQTNTNNPDENIISIEPQRRNYKTWIILATLTVVIAVTVIFIYFGKPKFNFTTSTSSKSDVSLNSSMKKEETLPILISKFCGISFKYPSTWKVNDLSQDEDKHCRYSFSDKDNRWLGIGSEVQNTWYEISEKFKNDPELSQKAQPIILQGEQGIKYIGRIDIFNISEMPGTFVHIYFVKGKSVYHISYELDDEQHIAEGLKLMIDTLEFTENNLFYELPFIDYDLNDSQVAVELSIIRNYVTMYFIDNNRYPATIEELLPPEVPTEENNRVMTDPYTGQKYIYETDGTSYFVLKGKHHEKGEYVIDSRKP